MAPMTLDDFFNMAQLGGQIKACHDIFKILQNDDISPEEKSMTLGLYQSDVVKDFKKAQLKFKMANGKVRMDEDSIEGLTDDKS